MLVLRARCAWAYKKKWSFVVVVLSFEVAGFLNGLSEVVTGVFELVVGKFAQVADLAEELLEKLTRLPGGRWKMNPD
jgi:hypothetical protein